MVRQELGSAQLMFVHVGPVIVLDTMLLVSGTSGLVMPATFVLRVEPRSLSARGRRQALARWTAAGAVCAVEVRHIDDQPYATFAAGGHRVTFRLAGCVSQPRLVIEAEA